MEKLIPGEEKTLEVLYEATKDEAAELRGELARAQKELEPWAEATSNAQSAVDIARSELDLLEGRARKAQAALEEAQRKLAEAAPSRKATQALISKKQVPALASMGQSREGRVALLAG